LEERNGLPNTFQNGMEELEIKTICGNAGVKVE
jgi:hypothetical protein